jgi:NADH-quinone oxidoreductase subunit N
MTTGAFAVLISLTANKQERTTLADLSGLGFKHPFLALALTFFMLSLTGIPPMVGFFGKYYLFLPAMQQGYTGLVILAVLNSVISAYYYLGPVVSMYFGRSGEAPAGEGAEPIGLSQAVFAVICLTLLSVVFFGLFPSSLLALVTHSV